MSLFSKKYPVTCHTDHVEKGSTFVAINGYKSNGTSFVEEAKKNGASKIIEHSKNQRITLAALAAKALFHPEKKLKIVAVTGTKGKTTTTHIVSHILRESGIKAAHLSSHDNRILNKTEASTLTTPPSDYLFMFLATALEQGVTHVVMEASSHGIEQHRLHGLSFDCIGFTNLGHDHFDFYKSMEEYFGAKLKIFNQLKKNAKAIVNFDDSWGRKITTPLISFGTNPKASKNLVIKQNSPSGGLNFCIGESEFYAPNLFGNFNAQNASMAILICQQLGLNPEQIKTGIATFKGVPGRMEQVTLKSGAKVIIDFAHNPSSMEVTLKELAKISSNLIVVFGAGGSKDNSKRPLMGKVAEKYAKKIILTSDNPRFENPLEIINDILSGIKDRSIVTIEPDRALAISNSIKISDKNSTIAILGKGAETSIESNGAKTFFNDIQEVKRLNFTKSSS
jgi:UDP-N-acetylmuramoyl-L-alanyl-D-glutamate--2,6-diaminopimelate ligase